MNIIIDSNILFSALIRDSTIRKLILDCDEVFLFPEYIFEELEEHKEELLRKSKMFEEEFNDLLQLILKKVKVIPNIVLIPYREEAVEIIKDIDIDDVIFIACALAYSDSAIWSEDKALKKQNRIKILNTAEAIDSIQKAF